MVWDEEGRDACDMNHALWVDGTCCGHVIKLYHCVSREVAEKVVSYTEVHVVAAVTFCIRRYPM